MVRTCGPGVNWLVSRAGFAGLSLALFRHDYPHRHADLLGPVVTDYERDRLPDPHDPARPVGDERRTGRGPAPKAIRNTIVETQPFPELALSTGRIGSSGRRARADDFEHPNNLSIQPRRCMPPSP